MLSKRGSSRLFSTETWPTITGSLGLAPRALAIFPSVALLLRVGGPKLGPTCTCEYSGMHVNLTPTDSGNGLSIPGSVYNY